MFLDDRPHFYGRRQGRRLRKAKSTLIDSFLPSLRLNPENPLDFLPVGKKLYLEIGFGDGDHLSFDEEAPVKQNLDDETNDVKDWRVGDIVVHKTLGRGVVIELEGDDIIKVDFKDHGIKSILSTHPNVSKGGHEA